MSEQNSFAWRTEFDWGVIRYWKRNEEGHTIAAFPKSFSDPDWIKAEFFVKPHTQGYGVPSFIIEMTDNEQKCLNLVSGIVGALGNATRTGKALRSNEIKAILNV